MYVVAPARSEVRRYVDRFYCMDSEFVGKYHALAGQPFSECLDYEMEQIETPGSVFYAIKEGSDQVALFSFTPKDNGICSLQFFFVNPKYRNKEDLKEVWNHVVDTHEESKFLVGIREKNPKAIRFYERMGMKYLFTTKDPKVEGESLRIYYFEKGVTWHQ